MTVRDATLQVVILVWLALSCAGLAVFNRYEFTPGQAAQPRLVWPCDVAWTPDPSRLTLVVAAHPRCACSNETVAELQELLQQFPGRASVHVFFFQPPGADPEWRSGSLWEASQALPGSTVTADTGGHLAAAFDAHTSGQVLAYSPQGRLLFCGGITTARGHSEGWNPGLDRLGELLQGREADGDGLPASPVYGCSLDEPDARLHENACGRRR